MAAQESFEGGSSPPSTGSHTTLALDIEMGRPSSQQFVMDGWGDSEESFRWAIGRTSRLRLPIQQQGQPHVVVLDVKPWLSPPRVTRQLVTFGINDRYAETLAVTHRMAIGLRVSPEQTRCDHLVISIDSLDSFQSATIDTYRNGLSMNLMVLTIRLFVDATRESLPVADLPPVSVPYDRRGRLISRFESLGHRCAFGLLQQRWHVEQLGLLRFAGIHTPVLVRELVRQFAGLASERDLHAFVPDSSKGLYSVYDRVREIWFNTSHPVETTTPGEVVRLAARRLTFLRRKFIEDLCAGHRVYVVNSPQIFHESEAVALLAALNLFGPNNLVWTNQIGDLPPGHVRRHAPGCCFGQLDRHGQTDGDPSDTAWFSVCENALRLLSSEYGFDELSPRGTGPSYAGKRAL